MYSPIPIAIALTADYALPAAVMLKSLLDSSQDRFVVYCLVSEPLPSNVLDGWEYMARGRVDVNCISLASALDGCYTDPRYTEVASYRLLLPRLLPQLDKLLYLDCDILIRQNMGYFFRETELGDKWMAVVYEAPIPGQIERIEKMGLSSKRYFNSGMLLMNLDQMRKDNVTEKLLEASRVDYLEFPDQDALNRVCQCKILPVSPLYNGIRTFFLPQYREAFNRQYPSAFWKEVQTSANIHYTGGKPWDVYTVKFGEWWRTYYSLPVDIKKWLHKPAMKRFLPLIYRSSFLGGILESARSIKRMIQ